MITTETTVVAAENQVAADLGGEMAILNLDNGVYYTLNEVGAYIWELIQSPTDVSHLKASLLAEYEVTPEACEAHLIELLEQLQSERLITVKNGKHP